MPVYACSYRRTLGRSLAYSMISQRYLLLWSSSYSRHHFVSSWFYWCRLGRQYWRPKIYGWLYGIPWVYSHSWKSGKQRTVARSSTEAEYKALADGTVEVLWLRYLLSDLCISPSSATTIWCDNLGATYLSANPIFHARTKHVEVDYHFVRDRVTKKEIQIRFIPSKDQLADILTKPLASSIFISLRSKLHVDNPPSAWGGILGNVFLYRKYLYRLILCNRIHHNTCTYTLLI